MARREISPRASKKFLVILFAVFCLLVTAAAFAAQTVKTATRIKPALLTEVQMTTAQKKVLALHPSKPATNSRYYHVSPSVLLPAFSLTQAEVQEDHGPDFRWWKKEMRLELNPDPVLMTPLFRWQTKQAQVKSAVWQVSVFPFPDSLEKWQAPPGLMLEGKLTEVPQTGKVSFFKIDFTRFVPRLSAAAANILKNSQIKTVPLNATGSAAGNQGTITIPKPGARNVVISKADLAIKQSLTITPAARKQLFVKKNYSYLQAMQVALPRSLPIDYYIRVVPLDANGNPIGKPSPSVIVTVAKSPPPNYEGIGGPIGLHPKVELVEFQPLRDRHPYANYHVIVTKEFPLFPYKIGDKLDLTPKTEDDSWWDDFCDAVGSLISYMSSAVNWVSNAYDAIKQKLVELVASALGDWAKGPLMMGLNIGMMAVGLPPDIPNFSELTTLGRDYLIKEIAAEAGIPEDVAVQAVDTMIEEAKKAENGGSNPSAWFKPDPAYQYRPATFFFNVYNPSNVASDPVKLEVTFVGTNQTLFRPATLPIPALQPGESLRVPFYAYFHIVIDSTGTSHVDDWQNEIFNLRKMTVKATSTYQLGSYFPQTNLQFEKVIPPDQEWKK